MSLEERIADELFVALQEERRWVTSDTLDAARVGAAAVVGLLRQGAIEQWWCQGKQRFYWKRPTHCKSRRHEIQHAKCRASVVVLLDEEN